MIPRHQIALFVVLLLTSITLGGVLWHLRERTHERMLAGQASTPTRAPLVAPLEQATLMVAQDADDTLQTRLLSLPLPPEPSARARAVLGKLLDLYSAPDATHPVPGGAASIARVFLVPVTSAGPGKADADKADAGKVDAAKTDAAAASESHEAGSSEPESTTTATESPTGPELAVVNLTGAFATNHPSGLETETLTVLSICATLHANLPRITEVRFLVDGEPRATLAGHADLTRTYIAGDTVTIAGARP